MGKKKGFRKKRGVELYDSDDERAYRSESVPDPTSSNYFNNEIDDFHADRDKIILGTDDNVSLLPKASGGGSDEEVLGFDDTDDEEEQVLITELRRRKQQLREQTTKSNLASDLEDSDADDVIQPGKNSQQWGKTRKGFYGSDTHKKDFGDYSDSEPNDYLLEEAEAKAIQRRQAELISESDFDVDFMQFAKAAAADTASSEKEKIAKDLTLLSTSEKWQMIRKESPELLPLIRKYQRMLGRLDDQLIPLMSHLGKHPRAANTDISRFVDETVCLWIDCCINISFYLLLKASNEPNIYDHPISKRIVEFQMLIKQLEAAESRFGPRLDRLVVEMKSLADRSSTTASSECGTKNTSDDIDNASGTLSKNIISTTTTKQTDSVAAGTTTTIKKKASKKKKTMKGEKRKLSELISDSESEAQVSSVDDDMEADAAVATIVDDVTTIKKQRVKEHTASEQEALKYYEMMTKQRNRATEENEELDDDDAESSDNVAETGGARDDSEDDTTMTADGRRAITKQIQKNRGLTPRRKKEYKNPRVKHRIKYRKAKIRRRGQIREVRHEMNPYAGELSGIRAAVKRGVHLRA